MTPTEFKALLDAAGLPQRRLALKHLGVAVSTVNRWCNEQKQHEPAPRYAVAFVLAYMALTLDQRAELERSIEAAIGDGAQEK